MILGDAAPWPELDLPWDEALGWDGIPWDREARPLLDEVTRTATGWPRAESVPFKECLQIVLSEEWEHRLYAERDLTALEKED